MQNVEQTIISQYGNSSIIGTLIDGFNQCVDPAADIDNFYNIVWNVETAQGFGLDIWGRIVGVSRVLFLPPSQLYFGFQTSDTDSQPFNQAIFYVRGDPLGSGGNVALGDDDYRTLIYVKALANISGCNAPTINQLLQNLFPGRGNPYMRDLLNMNIEYVFDFYLTPTEIAILTNSGALLRPAGVGVSIVIELPTLLSFDEASGNPFGVGTFNG